MPAIFWFLLICFIGASSWLLLRLTKKRELVESANFPQLAEKVVQLLENPTEKGLQTEILKICKEIQDSLSIGDFQLLKSKLVSAVYGITRLSVQANPSLNLSEEFFNELAKTLGYSHPDCDVFQMNSAVSNSETFFGKTFGREEMSRLLKAKNNPWWTKMKVDSQDSTASAGEANVDRQISNPETSSFPEWVYPSLLLKKKNQEYSVPGYPAISFFFRVQVSLTRLFWYLSVALIVCGLLCFGIFLTYVAKENPLSLFLGVPLSMVLAFFLLLCSNLGLAASFAAVEIVWVLLKIEENTRAIRK